MHAITRWGLALLPVHLPADRRLPQDFVGSVSALLRVRQGTVSLKHRVVELNEEVQKSGGGVADKVSSTSAKQVRLRSSLHCSLLSISHFRKGLF